MLLATPWKVSRMSLLSHSCRLLVGCFCFLFWVLWFAMLHVTTCVHVEFISNCFFTCKDRALERDRPYQRKKKWTALLAIAPAIVWKSLANFSWKGAREIVILAWSHKAGSAPRFSGVKKMLRGGCTLAIMVSSFSAAPTSSSSVGSSCAFGLGGHHFRSSESASSLVSSPSVVDSSSSEEGSATASPAPSGSGRLPARGYSCSSGAVRRRASRRCASK